MPYFENKPAPTQGPLLPRPRGNVDVIKEPDLKLSLKRKTTDSDMAASRSLYPYYYTSRMQMCPHKYVLF